MLSSIFPSVRRGFGHSLMLPRFLSSKESAKPDYMHLKDFMKNQAGAESSAVDSSDGTEMSPYLQAINASQNKGKVFVETYGCQMNEADTQIVNAIVQGAGYELTRSLDEADVVFLNTCAVRENAENKVWTRLRQIKSKRIREKRNDMVVGVLGCMAERLKTKLLEAEDRLVHMVVGPDAYRDIPRLLSILQDGKEKTAVNVQLSLEETYAEITPVRSSGTGMSAFVSIMRGCNNMCSYCIVPFTRGRERSRDVDSIVNEVAVLRDNGCKEVTLLGQNVNSYCDSSTPASSDFAGRAAISPGFSTIYKRQGHLDESVRFAELLDRVADVDPEMRVRFTSPHPKDFPDEVLHVIRDRPNVCSAMHMPAQSGSTAVLERMRRGYSRESYYDLVERVRSTIPGVSLSSDFIVGFCGETEEDHQDTLKLMRDIRFDQAFMFAYSVREKTHAHRKHEDDVPQDVKGRRLREVIDTFHENAAAINRAEVGSVHIVLVEGVSKRSEHDLHGRSDTNKRVVFPNEPIPASFAAGREGRGLVHAQPGDYVCVRVESTTAHTLRGVPLARTTIREWSTLCDGADVQAGVGSV